MDRRLFIERLIQCERRVCRLYQTLHDRPAMPPALRTFWAQMAEDGRDRRAFFERSAGLLNFIAALPEACETHLSEVEAKLAAGEEAVQRSDLSPDEALGYTLTLETPELMEIENAWIRGFAPPLKSLVNTNAPDRGRHLRRLANAVRTCNTKRYSHRQADTLCTMDQQQARNTKRDASG